MRVARRGFRAIDPYPLDLGILPSAAYSLRRVRRGYNGPAILVRRSNDDATLDIGFDGKGNLDTKALLDHCTSNSGFVVTWYDQSGNANDASNAAAPTAQPRIVNAGTLDTINGRPGMLFDGSNDNLITPSLPVTADNSALVVAERTSSATTRMLIASNLSNGNVQFRFDSGHTLSVIRQNQLAIVTSASVIPLGLAVVTFSGTTGITGVKAKEISTTAAVSVAPTTAINRIGRDNTAGWYVGLMCEIIIFNHYVESKVMRLERDAARYYGVL